MMCTVEKETQRTDLAALYTRVAFFSNHANISEGDVLATKNILFWVTVTPVIDAYGIMTINWSIPGNQFCPTTTIAGVTDNSNIELDNPAGFSSGDRVQILTTGDYSDRGITVSGSDLELSEPTIVLPTVGTTVAVKVAQKALIRGGTTSGTGELAFIWSENFVKLEGIVKTSSMVINLNGV